MRNRSIALIALVALACAAALAAAEPKAAPAKPAQAQAAKKETPKVDPAIQQVRDAIAKLNIDKKVENWKLGVPQFPQVAFTAGKTYYWDVETNVGKIRVKLLPDVAPNHVANFLYLTELGFFDDVPFWRVIPGFMAQGGDPTGRGNGGPRYKFAGEVKPEVKHAKPGMLSMANSGPGTDGSQFFLTFVPTPWLDGKHTIFGQVVEGMDTLKALEKAGSKSGRPTQPLKIVKATISVQ